MFLQKLGSKI
uniref:Uncharacterized protein n=1 Tax=Arundo donax TaxID=35708 RepID=A0A0A9AXB0_ARUDO